MGWQNENYFAELESGDCKYDEIPVCLQTIEQGSMVSAKDFEICSLLKRHKMEGMELLFNSYYKPLVVWADTFLHDVPKAEDLVQDFFLRLWETRRFEHLLPETLRAYLFTSVRNAVLNKMEKADPLANACDVALHDAPWEEYDSFEDDVFRRVEEELGKLPARSQEVIRGVYLRGRKYKELAEELGISVATVNSLLVSALKKLRQTLGDDPVKLISLFFLKKSLFSSQ